MTTTSDALLALLEGQADMARTLARIERKVGNLMALTAKEQTALDHLTATIDAVLAAVTTTTQGLKEQLTAMTALRDQLQAKDDVDVAAVAAANDVIAGLQATLTSQETDVVAALTGLDEHVQALGGA